MSKLGISKKINLHDLTTVRLKSLWVLDNCNEALTASAIAKKMVSEHSIACSHQAVRQSFKNKNGAVHVSKQGFTIMDKGRDELLAGASIEDSVYFIEPGKPFTAKTQKVKDIFSKLSCDIYICDPYIDVNTLDVLFRYVDKKACVHLLTQKVNDVPKGIFNRVLADLKKESCQIEVRIAISGVLHDRYIMSKDKFWISGNSLNHIGNKESLLVSLGEDVRKSMSAVFQGHWKTASVHK